MKLSELILPENNNLDIFRVLAAVMVIYGHAYALSPQDGKSDFIGASLGFDYSGSLAVKIFFFISGLVVGNSLITKRNVVDFVISRLFRIMPGLILVILTSALIIGPIFTSLSLSSYFSDLATYKYIYTNLFFQTNYNLPGLFLDNTYPQAVNGSLWTLPYEVACYALLLGFFAIGVFEVRVLVVIFFTLFIIDPYIGNKIIFTWRTTPNHEIDFLAPCFAIGVFMAFFKEKIFVNFSGVVGFLLVHVVFIQSTYKQIFFYFFIFYLILYISSLNSVVRLKMKKDLSYGVYLWGFIVQQILAKTFPGKSVLFNQIIAITLSLVIAWLSFVLAEAPAMKFGNKLKKLIKNDCM